MEWLGIDVFGIPDVEALLMMLSNCVIAFCVNADMPLTKDPAGNQSSSFA